MHEELQGGGLRVPKILYARILYVLHLLLKFGLPPAEHSAARVVSETSRDGSFDAPKESPAR